MRGKKKLFELYKIINVRVEALLHHTNLLFSYNDILKCFIPQRIFFFFTFGKLSMSSKLNDSFNNQFNPDKPVCHDG